MKFIVASSTLLKHLQQINGVINSNPVMPILEDFLFEIQDKKLRITASDMETIMRVEMEVESKEEGSICIPAKILIDSLKNIPDQPIAFSIEENLTIEITTDNGKYKVMGEEAKNFPKEPLQNESHSLKLQSKQLINAINKTIFAVSNDDLRPAMTGVFMEIEADSLLFVATDAHRLVKYRIENIASENVAAIIIPRKPLTLIKSSLPNNEDELSIHYNANHLFIAHPNIQIICRLINGRYPDYKVVIPKENPYELVVNKADFQNALRRINVFANKSTNQVAVQINGSELILNGQDADLHFEGNERMFCQYTGEDMTIGFNAKFLVEMLQAIDTVDVRFSLSMPNKAILINPFEQVAGENLLMLIMPLTVTNFSN